MLVVGTSAEEQQASYAVQLLKCLLPWAKNPALIVLSAHLDASGKFSDPNMVSVTLAGFVAEEDDWTQLDGRWRQILDRPQYKAPYFHCKEAFHLRGAFETWTRRRVDELYRHLLAIVKTYASFGTISTVDLGAFKEVFGEADDPLFLCFRHAMLSMESSASRFGPDAIALIVDQARISDLAPLTARVYTLTRRSATISPPERGGG